MASWEHFTAFKALQDSEETPAEAENEGSLPTESQNPSIEHDSSFDDWPESEGQSSAESQSSSEEDTNPSDAVSQTLRTAPTSPEAGVHYGSGRPGGISQTSMVASASFRAVGVHHVPPYGPIRISSLETAGFVRQLLLEADILSVESPQKRAAVLKIKYPYNPLLIIRSKLVHAAEQDSTEPSIRDDINSLLEILLLEHRDSTHKSDNMGIARIATQTAIIDRGNVKFSELATLFLPGELVYTKTVENPRQMTQDLAYEQCWVLASCTNTTFNGRRSLAIRAIEWVWDELGLAIRLKNQEVMLISEYLGEKDICLSSLGIIPFKVLPEGDRLQIQNRLVARGRKYFEILRYEGSSWQYAGPTVRTEESHWNSIMNLYCIGEVDRGPWNVRKTFNATIRTRVLLVPILLAEHVYDDAEVWPLDVLKRSDRLTDETYMISSGIVRAVRISNSEQILIHVGDLQPIQWDEETLQGTAVDTNENLLNTVQEAFLFENDTPNNVIQPCQGFVVSIRAYNSDLAAQKIGENGNRAA